MRLMSLGPVCLVTVLALAACDETRKTTEVGRADDPVNVIDASNLNDIMLTVADPEEAVAYFTRAAAAEPKRIEFQRGLAYSLLRARRAQEAVIVYEKIAAGDETTNEDRINLADAYIRTGDWKAAEAELDKVPPTVETYKRYRLEAMVADANKEWQKADSFYETAAGLTTQPAGVYNNWGFSKLTRGDYREAERLFTQAITYDRELFTAKNNLVLARAAQRKYTLPLIQMTQVEKAQLLYTMAISAIRQDDVAIGKGLLEEAIDTHPRHFEEAVIALEALQNNIVN